MGFHRLIPPSYLGGLPSDYDYLNNAVVPPGSSAVPAVVDDPKGGGPNAGTYFIGFGEDARSPATNRGLSALGENTDFLDDVIHREIALPVRTDVATAPTTGQTNFYITLLGPGIWLGDDGGNVLPYGVLFQIVDPDDRPIYANDGSTDGTGNPQDYELAVQNLNAPPFGGDGRGGGFSPGNVTLILNRSLPHGIQYRVRYYRRGNLTDLSQAALAMARDWADSAPITSTPYGSAATNVDFQVQDIFKTLNGLDRLRVSAGRGPMTDATNNLFVFDRAAPWTRDHVLVVNPSLVADSYGPPSVGLPLATEAKGLSFLVINTDGTLRPGAVYGQGGPHSIAVLTNSGAPEKVNGVDWNVEGGSYQLDVPNGIWLILSDGTDWIVRCLNEDNSGRTATGDAGVMPSDTVILSQPTANGDGTATAANVNIQLPPPARFKGRVLDLWIRGAETAGTDHTTTLLPAASENIEGLADPYIIYTNNSRWSVLSDGTNWYVS